MSHLNCEVAEKLREHLSEQLIKDGKQSVRTVAELYEVTGRNALCVQKGL